MDTHIQAPAYRQVVLADIRRQIAARAFYPSNYNDRFDFIYQQARLRHQFFKLVLVGLDLTDNPKSDQICEYAWEMSYDRGGFTGVLNSIIDLQAFGVI